MFTRLELFIRKHGLKPAHLARGSGYARYSLVRLRTEGGGTQRARRALTDAAAFAVGRPVAEDELFEPPTLDLLDATELATGEGPDAEVVDSPPTNDARVERLASRLQALSDSGSFRTWLSRTCSDVSMHSEATARMLIRVGSRLLDQDPRQARAVFAAAERVASLLADTPAELIASLCGYALKGAANAQRMLGEYRQALQSLIDAEQAFLDARFCRKEVADVKYVRATILLKKTEFDDAESALRSAESTYAVEHDTAGLLRVRMLRACILFERGDFGAARREFLTLKKSYEKKGDRVTLGRVFLGLGACDAQLPDSRSAAPHWLDRAMKVFVDEGHSSEVARVIFWRAKYSLAIGKMPDAVRDFKRVVHRFERAGMRVDAGFALLELTKLYSSSGRRREAHRAAVRAAELFTSAGARMQSAESMAALQHLVRNQTVTPEEFDSIAAALRSRLARERDEEGLS